MTDTEIPEYGRLLEAARGKMSKREAARRASISEGRWRQIVSGVQKVGGGVEVPTNPKRETLLAMADAVGADGREVLRAAGFKVSWGLGPGIGALIPAAAEPSGVEWLRGVSDADLLTELARRLEARDEGSGALAEDQPLEVTLAARHGRVDTEAVTGPQDEVETGTQDDGDMEPR